MGLSLFDLCLGLHEHSEAQAVLGKYLFINSHYTQPNCLTNILGLGRARTLQILASSQSGSIAG